MLRELSAPEEPMQVPLELKSTNVDDLKKQNVPSVTADQQKNQKHHAELKVQTTVLLQHQKS